MNKATAKSGSLIICVILFYPLNSIASFSETAGR